MMTKKEQRLRRSRQTRERIATQGVARLTVFRSNLHIYANIISPTGDRVLVSASTLEPEVRAQLVAAVAHAGRRFGLTQFGQYRAGRDRVHRGEHAALSAGIDRGQAGQRRRRVTRPPSIPTGFGRKGKPA
mgnify:CR=1 FL=1